MTTHVPVRHSYATADRNAKIDWKALSIYAEVTADAVGEFMISHFTAGGLMLDLVVEFARRAGGVIFSSFGPTLLLNEAQRSDLPPGDRDKAVVVYGGPSVIETLSNEWDAG